MTTALEKLILACKIDVSKIYFLDAVSLDFIEENPMRPWIYQSLSFHKDITIDYVIDHPALPWTYYDLSKHKNITLNDILDNPELPWNYTSLGANPNITLDMIQEYDLPWDFNIGVSNNPNLNIEFVLNNIDKKWNWDYISEKVATENAVRMYPALPWNFNNLTINSNISLEFIRENPELPWIYSKLATNPNATFEDCENYVEIDLELMYKRFSKNMLNKYLYDCLDKHLLFKYADLDDIEKYIGDIIPDCLSENSNVSLDFIKKHMKAGWDFNKVLHIPNITWTNILESDDEFHWTSYRNVYWFNRRN